MSSTSNKPVRDKRGKFVEIASRRVNRVIKEIRLISNLSNRSAYEYTEEDAKKIARALQKELDVMKAKLDGAGRSDDNEFSL
jgi:hypothetical protein